MTVFKDERVVLERNYDAILPKLLMVIGGIIMGLGGIVGLMVAAEEEDPSLLILSLIFGGILFAIGYYLKSRCAFRLVVTTKRVVQDGPFDQFVTIPLSHISGISIKNNQLHVSAAGANIFVGIPDSAGVCNTIACLLNQLQTEAEPQQPAAAPSTPFYTAKPSTAPTGAEDWVCACGRVNPKYQTTCSCGAKKPH